MTDEDEAADDAFPFPSGDHLASLCVFFKDARFMANGSVQVTFTVDRDMKDRIIALSTNSGMKLNMTIWEQDTDTDTELGRLLGHITDEPADDE